MTAVPLDKRPTPQLARIYRRTDRSADLPTNRPTDRPTDHPVLHNVAVLHIPVRFATHVARQMGLVLLLLLLASTVSMAQDAEPFVVKRAEFNLDQSLMLLDLVVDSEIPDYILIAIEQGFSVPIMFEVEILASKRYWFDDPVVSLKQQYRLHYQPMLDSYVVFDVNSSERRYFADRAAAVRFVEVVYNYPMLNIKNLAPDREYYARVRFGIDSDELPLPLKSSSLWDNDWDLTSDWFEWAVQSPES